MPGLLPRLAGIFQLQCWRGKFETREIRVVKRLTPIHRATTCDFAHHFAWCLVQRDVPLTNMQDLLGQKSVQISLLFVLGDAGSRSRAIPSL